MIIRPDCVPCLMKRVLFQARMSDPENEFASVKAGLDAMSELLEVGKTSVDIATEVHRRAYSMLRTDDPYHDLKVRADTVAGNLMPEASRMVSESDDPLRTAMIISIAGNIMDFGSGNAIDSPEEFNRVFDSLVEQGIDDSDFEQAKDAILNAPGIVYIFDNCGESQLDKLLIRQLKGMGKRVVGVVRGAPILNDVTISDAIRSGLDTELDSLLDTGKFYVGIDLSECPEEVLAEVERCGLVIAKGMANYEALSSQEFCFDIIHILRSKCIPVSSSIGVPLGTNVVKLFSDGKYNHDE